MKKNITFERWVADGLTNGLIFMEPYGYRELDLYPSGNNPGMITIDGHVADASNMQDFY